jgi:hypothetical protein
MTQYPNYPPGQPLGYAAAEPARPTSVTVLGIIGIILSALGLICTPAAMIPYFTDLAVQDPVMNTIKNDRALFATLIVQMVLAMLLAFVELAGSIGSLMLKPWARKTMVWWAWAAIALGVLGTIMTLAWIMPKVTRANPNPAAAWGGMIGGVVGGLVGLIFPIFVLIYFNRDYVKAAFERGSAGGPAAPPPPGYGAPPPPRVPY